MSPARTLLAAAIAIAVAACSDTPTATDAVDGLAFAKPLGPVGSATSSYLIIANGNSLPGSLARDVQAAGGVITVEIPEIGVALVTSDSPGFGNARIRGASVVADVTLQWIDPDAGVNGLAIGEIVNPPNSGDDDFFFDLQWGHDAVDAPEAWDAGARGAGVRVAVLDSGIDANHPDLIPNLNVGLSTSFVPAEGPFDIGASPFSHGTHTSGIVAAADNAVGTIGVAPDAELVMVKVLSAFTGNGSFGGIIAGIVYAANIDADIINMSLGATLSHRGEFFSSSGVLLGRVPAKEINELLVAFGRATTYAYQNGTTIIASAGNAVTDGDKDKDRVHVPSDSPYVISIAATAPIGWAVDPSTNLDNPASYTNTGQSVISFAAPGGDFVYPGSESCTVGTIIPVTRPCGVFDLVFSTGNQGWFWNAGTSMAAPHASGVAAIIIGQNGGPMHPAQVEAALRASADDLGKPGNDDFYGAGRVNAGNSVP